MKLYKNILLSFVSAIVTVVVVYGGYTIYAVETYPNGEPILAHYYHFTAKLSVLSDFLDGGVTFNDVSKVYNGDMNDYFNRKFMALTKLIDNNERFFENKKFKRPEGIKSDSDFEMAIEKCKLNNKNEEDEKDDNLSSYCVSMGALQRYMVYVSALNVMKGEKVKNPSYPSLAAIVAETGERNRLIDLEYEKAKQVMEATVATYNEFSLAYPMHKKYRDIMKNLIKYKLALKDIRKRLALWPGKFHDATSSQCQ